MLGVDSLLEYIPCFTVRWVGFLVGVVIGSLIGIGRLGISHLVRSSVWTSGIGGDHGFGWAYSISKVGIA